MSTLNDPVAEAEEVRDAIRTLDAAARATGDPDSTDSTDWILGSISAALTSLGQTLHQLAAVTDSTVDGSDQINDDPRADRAASYRQSWDLHRAAEMVHQVASVVDQAHGNEPAKRQHTVNSAATHRLTTHEAPEYTGPAPVTHSSPASETGMSR